MAPLTPPPVLDTPVDLDTTLAFAADRNDSPRDAKEAFWVQPDIQLTRWNKLYPYQLLVVRAVQTGSGDVSYQPEPGWEFTLPIPPEAYSIGMPFAISTHATLGGIVEEHNGAPFRMISIRGTTGVLPGRAGAPQQLGFSAVETIFAGTVSQAQRVGDAVSDTIASATGVAPQNNNLHKQEDFEVDETNTGAPAFVAKTTGYYQFRKLQRFFEAYVAMKQTRPGRDLRLAFAAWKDQSVYLVTPVSFEVTKSGESPLEYPYSLVMKAWRRIVVDAGGFSAVLPKAIKRDPNALMAAMNTLGNARRVLQSVSKLADAVVGDATRIIFEPLREGMLFAKDLLGVPQSMAEMPDDLKRQMKAAYVVAVGEDFASGGGTTEKDTTAKRARVQAGFAANETADLPRRAPAEVAATASRAKALASHPASHPFKNPNGAYDTFSKVDVGKLKLPPAVQQRVTAEAARVRNLRRKDFEDRRDQLLDAHARLAIAVGAGNATFEDTYGLTNVPALKDEPTDSDWEALFALNASIQVFDAYAATADGDPSATEGIMESMAALARRSGIAFQVPVSKFAVPFVYGWTLEKLAKTYLNDANRWHEIAALNGLRAPYVDEVGFDLLIATNGAANQVIVADASNLYVGQTCFIWSDQTRRTRRRIVALRPVGATTVVTVDGTPDMSRYRVADAAKLSSFLPDTVNSQQLVYIPSSREPYDDDAITKDIPGVNEFDPMVAAGGVDWLLDSNNDLVITPDGDNRWAVGLTNIIQGIRIALSVRRGGYLRHPEFGLPIQIGMAGADFDATEVLSAVRKMFAADKSVVKVLSASVTRTGARAAIDAAIVVQGTERPVPLRFDVDRDFKLSPQGEDPDAVTPGIIPVVVPVAP